MRNTRYNVQTYVLLSFPSAELHESQIVDNSKNCFKNSSKDTSYINITSGLHQEDIYTSENHIHKTGQDEKHSTWFYDFLNPVSILSNIQLLIDGPVGKFNSLIKQIQISGEHWLRLRYVRHFLHLEVGLDRLGFLHFAESPGEQWRTLEESWCSQYL